MKAQSMCGALEKQGLGPECVGSEAQKCSQAHRAGPIASASRAPQLFLLRMPPGEWEVAGSA
eukprot:14896140-Alexandrium_andersonii.AAC.1